MTRRPITVALSQREFEALSVAVNLYSTAAADNPREFPGGKALGSAWDKIAVAWTRFTETL